MNTGVQFRGTLAANASNRWFTFNWPADQHVLWEVVPTSPRPGAAEVNWNVAIERADAQHVTYWITITNLTNAEIQFEARYATLN